MTSLFIALLEFARIMESKSEENESTSDADYLVAQHDDSNTMEALKQEDINALWTKVIFVYEVFAPVIGSLQTIFVHLCCYE